MSLSGRNTLLCGSQVSLVSSRGLPGTIFEHSDPLPRGCQISFKSRAVRIRAAFQGGDPLLRRLQCRLLSLCLAQSLIKSRTIVLGLLLRFFKGDLRGHRRRVTTGVEICHSWFHVTTLRCQEAQRISVSVSSDRLIDS
jgi:hypothetical protein